MTRYARAAGGAAETLLKKYGKDVIQKEYHQDRLANVAIDLYGSLAVLSRATAAIARSGGGAAKTAEEVRLAKAFVRGAKYRMVGQLKEMDKAAMESRRRSRRPPTRRSAMPSRSGSEAGESP